MYICNHTYICIYVIIHIWGCQRIPRPFRDVCLGGMIRGYDSGYDSGVWFAGMIRGPWFSVSPHPPRKIFTHMYPQNVSNLSNYTTRGALWSWPAVAAARVRSEWCVRFGVGMLVPLQAATFAAGCCCRIFLRSSRRHSLWRVVAKEKMLTEHKSWLCKCTMVQTWEVWSMIRVWFGYDSGYDSESHFFLEFRKPCCLRLFSSTVNPPRLAAMARPAGLPACPLDHFWCTFSSAMLATAGIILLIK